MLNVVHVCGLQEGTAEEAAEATEEMDTMDLVGTVAWKKCLFAICC